MKGLVYLISNGSLNENNLFYSAHNFATKVSEFVTYMSVHDGDHGGAVRMFVGISEELYWQRKSDQVCASNGNQRKDKRAQNSTTKVSFCTIIIRLVQWTIAIAMV